MHFAIFTKHLQGWPLNESAARVKSAGFDGLDLTVRPGGYVEASDIAAGLPRAVRAVRDAGLQVPLITTAIVSATDPAARPTFATAAELGVREIKLGYWPYETIGSLRGAIDRVRRELDALEQLARDAGVRINIHNHCGDFIQNSPFAVAELLRDRDPRFVGCYFDPAHYTIEGGLSGWKHALDLLAPRVTLLAVKDSKWVDVPGLAMPAQERRWVPVGSGNVRWREVLGALRQAGFDGWASIHCEYQGRWTYRELNTAEVLEHGAADLRFIRGVGGGGFGGQMIGGGGLPHER